MTVGQGKGHTCCVLGRLGAHHLCLHCAGCLSCAWAPGPRAVRPPAGRECSLQADTSKMPGCCNSPMLCRQRQLMVLWQVG